MPSSSSIHQQNSSDNDDDFEIVERDPTGRYVRYSEILGEGSTKTVYKAFDEINGTEVAWNQINLSEDILNSGKHLQRICSEAHLLKTLKHDNVIRCFHSWIDTENKTINMITELFTSGNLRLYRGKHGGLNTKAIKKWAVQILRGLDYLHSQNPPIVHRDLRCDNIFVNGNSGNVKIGDLGLATVLQHGGTAHSVIGMPEFMAPELYEEEYDQKVDIYSFGMCMLQMVTRESPYCECKNPAQVFKKVTSGVKPESLRKVTDARVKKFIEKCLAPVEQRPSASDLLHDPFLCPVGVLLKVAVTEKNTFRITGEMKDGRDSVSMILWVADLDGEPKRVDFVFFLETDTVVSVTEEMVRELELSSRDAVVIAELMAELITELVPDC